MPFIRSAKLSLGITLGLAAIMGVTPACKKNEPQPQEAAPAATAAKDTSASCVSDPRVRPYADNMKIAGNSQNLTFVIVSASPTPPAGGKNAWTVRLQNASGAQATGYTLTASPYMPDHGHGPDTAPQVAARGNDFVISGIDFFMGGVWRTTLTAKDAQGNTVDAANVFFCVPG